MLDNFHARFPYLVGYILFFGAPLGICLGTVRRFPSLQQVGVEKFDLSRAAVVGGLAGIVGGWAFAQWMAKANHFPLIAGLIHLSPSRWNGVTFRFRLHYWCFLWFAVSARRSRLWIFSRMGIALRNFLVVSRAMTIMPLWQGRKLDWSYQHGQELYESLVGHIVYGLIVGVIYAAVDRLCCALFIESDPINRQPEAPGSRSLRSIGWGTLAGLVFLPTIAAVTGLTNIAALVGSRSSAIGVLIHFLSSGLIGISYGLLFERESPDFTVLPLGLVVCGSLTFFPILKGLSLTWTRSAVLMLFPCWLVTLFTGL